ncbi:MAG: UPF0158 family protein [Myxococcales bacterium]|nr:UPF0158 family protein [Myxococcota bacterium]MDW8282139.1 UPF0158 family protein [Myxococcales bacterium]
MRVIPIRWAELETAFERNAPDTESYLDSRTGEVVTIVDSNPDAHAMRGMVASGGDIFIRIEPASSREQYRWMERFVASVADEALRERLSISIDGKGAFRRFKDVLLNYPSERERWFAYRADLLHWHMQEWLKREGIQARDPPPWGEVERPPELEVVAERPAVSAEGPGEMLRRQARELIEQIPAVELPAAIAFLDFLKERGVAELNRLRGGGHKRTAA